MMDRYSLKEAGDIWEAENVYFLKSHPSRIGKFLAHYELYKKILSVPGCFMELGLFRGASFTRFATFRSLLENDDARAFYGFDAFGKFPRTNVEGDDDLEFIDKWEEKTGTGISKAELEVILGEKGFSNFQLFEGDVFETIPKFIGENPQLRIAMLHLDMDVYEPTKFCLDVLVPLMCKNGLVVFDDYNAVEGATRAADEISSHFDYPLSKLPFYNVPSFFQVT